MQRSKIELLPAPLRDELGKKLVAGAFSGYAALEKWLAGQGAAIGLRGEEIPKRSSIHRYGSHLQEKLEAIRASTDAARQIAEAAPDDADLRSSAVISLVQTEVFDLLVRLREADKETDTPKRVKLLSAVAGNIAKLSRASVNQKRWEQEIRGKVKAAADSIEKIAKKGGLSKAAVAEIRREILGIPQ
jgi:hypothetical protein